MIPRVIFRYSWIYDDIWKENVKHHNNYGCGKYPSSVGICNYIKKIEKLWRKDEKKVLTELSRISGLKWKEKEVICYVVGNCIPFSEPLTIPVYGKYPDFFIAVLIHEMIHQLFTQGNSLKKANSAWNYIWRKYKNESDATRIHIPLYAIHTQIYNKFYDEDLMRRDRYQTSSNSHDHKRAWEIVQKEGYQNIINEFKKRI